MFRNLSRTWIVVIAFCAGIATAAALILGIAFIASTSVTIRELEEDYYIPIVPDEFIGEYPEVYIRDMTLVEMIKEGKELSDMGDALTLNVMIDRYDLHLPDKADVFLTPKVRDLPLKEVFSEDGMDLIMNTVYVGEFRGYEQRKIDGKLVWYDPVKDQPIKGINRITSSLTLAETLSGDFSFSSLLDDLTLGEALGYELVDGVYYNNGKEVTGVMGVVSESHINDISEKFDSTQLAEIFGYEERDGVYYDEDGEKVFGLMAILCDASIHDVPDRIESATFAEILGYELGEDGCYYDNGEKVTSVMAVIADSTVTTAPDTIENSNMGEIMGYTYDSASGLWKDSEGNDVHTLMNTISGKKISELNNLYKDLTVADVIPAEEREDGTGYVSLLDPTTPVNEISDEVNRVFKENTMRDFVACGAITFENDPDGTKANDFVNSTSPMADMTMDEMLTFMFSNQDTFDQLYSSSQ